MDRAFYLRAFTAPFHAKVCAAIYLAPANWHLMRIEYTAKTVPLVMRYCWLICIGW